MTEDQEGFLRPTVDAKKCLECGKCEKLCPMCRQRNTDGEPEYGVFAAKVEDEDVHKRSQSGGVFYALAEHILSQGGAVYGAALNERFETEHIRVNTVSQLHRLQGVKYVQSRLGSVFSQVEEDLRNAIDVLFSGTPCQVAGLQAYLAGKKADRSKLLTADLVCYGVPSPGVFREWVKCLEKTHKSSLKEMHYRLTDKKWGKGKEYYRLSNGTVLEGDYYTRWYFRNLIIRPSCESCQFCNTERAGDITLGDFWGIKNCIPDFYDDRGVSLVMCSTLKGKQALEVLRNVERRESCLEDAIASQPRLQNISVKANTSREQFWEKYDKKGLSYLAMEEGFIPPDFLYRVKQKVLHLIRKVSK